ncbi:TlpA family protein disulfide reductase [Balneola sp. MJW-20]|uniref:TlpA family protein disulfide reductase n=1 Tax=Gracilimonas aurantiaca TaxID=3234185 RepID=UPI003465D67E
MKNIILTSLLVFALIAVSCSGDSEAENEAVLLGEFSIADSVASDSLFGPLSMVIFSQDTASTAPDTLSYISIGSDGSFAQTITFPKRAIYNFKILSGSNELVASQILLANNDTLNMSGSIPGLAQNIDLKSGEYEALDILNRVDNQYNRVVSLISRGAVADSLIGEELNKWANSYWEVYETYPGSFAADLAFLESVKILNIINKEKMFSRIEEELPKEFAIGSALNYGTEYVSNVRGLEGAVSYLDSLEQLTQIDRTKELISRVRISLLYDSAEVKRAKELTDVYEKQYANSEEARQWVKNIRYDLNYLAPGVRAPEFNFITMDGDTLSNESLNGRAFVLEITPLAAGEYQREYDRMIAIHEVYKNYGLEIITVPLDESEVTVEAFYETRGQHWPTAKLGTFDVQELIQEFNIQQVPTWLLVDQNGEVVKKYVRSEIKDIIQGLGTVFSNSNDAS